MKETHKYNYLGVELSSDFPLTNEEVIGYINHYLEQEKGNVAKLELKLVDDNEGEFVDVVIYSKYQPFQRIRRITGYLVESTSRWNSAKKAELSKRVKHNSSLEDLKWGNWKK